MEQNRIKHDISRSVILRMWL